MYLIKATNSARQKAEQTAKENGHVEVDSETGETWANVYKKRGYLMGYEGETFTICRNDCRIEVIPSLATGFSGVKSSDLPDGVEFVSEIEGGRKFIRNVQRWVAERERKREVGEFDNTRLM